MEKEIKIMMTIISLRCSRIDDVKCRVYRKLAGTFIWYYNLLLRCRYSTRYIIEHFHYLFKKTNVHHDDVTPQPATKDTSKRATPSETSNQKASTSYPHSSEIP